MDLILVRLTAGAVAPDPLLNPEIAADILWAAAVPDDRLEHIRARHGPGAATIDVALFLRADGGPVGIATCPSDRLTATAPARTGVRATRVAETALDLCRRAIGAAPAFGGWTAALVPPQPDLPFPPHSGDSSTPPN